jgi:hypothetical protein
MSLEDDLNAVNAEYAKMTLETELNGVVINGFYAAYGPAEGNYVYGDFISTHDLFALLLETYQKAIEIGWETRALDALATKIRLAGQSKTT